MAEQVKHVSKVIYGSETLIDLTSDTVTADKLKSGYTAHDKSGAAITGTCTHDADTSDASATASEILATKTAYVKGSKVTGIMPNKGAEVLIITKKGDKKTISQGYHDGSGYAQIAATEQQKIIPTNIRDGVSILGVTGTMTGTEDVVAYSGTVTPSRTSDIELLPPEGYNYISSVIVKKIPYEQVENPAGGYTVTIASSGSGANWDVKE